VLCCAVPAWSGRHVPVAGGSVFLDPSPSPPLLSLHPSRHRSPPPSISIAAPPAADTAERISTAAMATNERTVASVDPDVALAYRFPEVSFAYDERCVRTSAPRSGSAGRLIPYVLTPSPCSLQGRGALRARRGGLRRGRRRRQGA
uniref:Uncharacterized protein n=1 Tax=Triticum urartu TaxID=4572 RepID=A0A8R7QEU4_TRIUA